MRLSRLLLCLLLGGALWPAGAARGADAAGPLEFRGVVETGGSVKVGLLDQATGAVFWTKVPAKSAPPPDKISEGVAVREYDPQHNRLTVDYHGRTYALVLAEAVLVIAPPPPPPPEPSNPDAATAAGDTPAVAPEVQRRQSLRQVEVVNEALRATGADESQVLPGNPTDTTDAPPAAAPPADTPPPTGPADGAAAE